MKMGSWGHYPHLFYKNSSFIIHHFIRGGLFMELYDVMRTTFAAREFTDDPLTDTTLFKILDNARFAPTGGNRQGGRVIVVRERKTREALAALAVPAAKRYAAQVKAGENPWNSIDPTLVDAATIERTKAPAPLTESFLGAAVVLVVCVDLKVVAATDQALERVGVISGASIYPFVWNILLAARHEGYGGTITTLAVAQEPKLQELLDIPQHLAVCAVMPLGRPVRQLTKLKRGSVSSFTMLERWGGEPLTEGSGD
jgi:nitroreductase